MKVLEAGVKMTDLPWSDHMVLSSKEIVDVDPEDGTSSEIFQNCIIRRLG